MFYSVTGKVVAIEESFAAIQCGGIAFRCMTTLNTLSKIGKTGEEVTLYTYLNVREDAMELFGFYTQQELQCFKQLISVSGVGPKAALAILSQLSPDQLALCVASGDVKSITKAQGVGPKLAQRVVLELKDKLSKSIASESIAADSVFASPTASGNCSEAIEALVMLGYSRSEAAGAINKLDRNLPVEELIRLALKSLI
ncbi:MAG: Holliday junction branch migration protein RuvA [Clostridia bacterium]|nr:Holliday junction branch migration protein RuvA [Clostridia bacterium]